jgi:capsular polysaccharide biosynthesis protein
MPDQAAHPSYLAAVRRQWWIPLACALVAAVVAGVATSKTPAPEYQARAVVVIDNATLSAYPDLPRPDDMLKEIKQDEFIAFVGDAAAVETETVNVALDAFTLEDRQSQLVVTFESPTESVATSAAVTAATRVTELASELSGKEIKALRQRVEATERALKAVRRIALDAGKSAPASLALDLIGTEWEMQLRLYEDRLHLRAIESAYYYNGNVRITNISPALRRSTTVAGAIVVGLLLGLVIAVFREALFVRKSAPAA